MIVDSREPRVGDCFRNGPLAVKPPHASRRRFHASVRGRHVAATPCDQKGTREPISQSVMPVREGGLTSNYPASSDPASRRRDLGRLGG